MTASQRKQPSSTVKVFLLVSLCLSISLGCEVCTVKSDLPTSKNVCGPRDYVLRGTAETERVKLAQKKRLYSVAVDEVFRGLKHVIDASGEDKFTRGMKVVIETPSEGGKACGSRLEFNTSYVITGKASPDGKKLETQSCGNYQLKWSSLTDKNQKKVSGIDCNGAICLCGGVGMIILVVALVTCLH